MQEVQRKKLITDQEDEVEEKEKEYSTFLSTLKNDIESRE
jgi:phage host-nuclease inhibitor protein Gam